MFENGECGIIKWVPRVIREGKHFGFIRCADGKSLFFPFDGGMTLFSDGTWRREIEKNPKPGERIIFERGENHKGVCANPWAYVASPEEACNICITPPKLKYRVMRETIFASREGLFVSPEPEWEGDDLKELARKHPRTGTSMDDFRLYKTPGFSTKGIFQVEDTADEWIEIPDPRPLLQTRVHELAAA